MTHLLANATINIRQGLEQYSQQPVETSITPIIADVVNAAILIAALLFLLYLLLGAIQWLTSGGDKGKVESARDKIIQAFIGLVIVVFAYAIYLFVIDYLGIGLSQAGGGTGSAIGRYTGGKTGDSGSGGGGGGVCTPGQSGTYAGDYCTSGAARMKCFGPGEGVSRYPYNHWEPCDCLNGAGAQNNNYNFSSC